MTFLDIVIAIPLVIFIWKGWHKGLVFEVANLPGLIVGIYCAVHFSCKVAGWLNMDSDTPVLLSFFVTFLLVIFASHLLGKCIEKFLKLVKVGFLNNLLGGLIGMLECVCILSVLIYYIEIIDKHEIVLTHQAKVESKLYKPVNRTGNKLIGSMKQMVVEYRANHTSEKK